ncbi:MAG: hypothetical protein LRZ84_14725 [Desertifilum sp.]|nr:hypothetical protein [Desertifilum sp.]
MRPKQVRLPVVTPQDLKSRPQQVGKIASQGAFYFEGGSFRIQEKGGNGYWYVTAYVEGRLRKRYLGKDISLTVDALRAYLERCYEEPKKSLPTKTESRVGKVSADNPSESQLIEELRDRIRELEAENAILKADVKAANDEADEFEIEKIYIDQIAMRTVAAAKYEAKQFREIYQAFFSDLIDKARLKQSQKLSAISQLTRLNTLFDRYIIGHLNRFWFTFLESGVELEFYSPDILTAFIEKFGEPPTVTDYDRDLFRLLIPYQLEPFKSTFIDINMGYHALRKSRLSRFPQYAKAMKWAESIEKYV